MVRKRGEGVAVDAEPRGKRANELQEEREGTGCDPEAPRPMPDGPRRGGIGVAQESPPDRHLTVEGARR